MYTLPDPQNLTDHRLASTLRHLWLSLAILIVCGVWFHWDLAAEPHFVDESAYVSQAFYGDLLCEGRWNHPAWLDYAGYDLPPLPKYLIGLALWVEGYRRPTLTDAHAWYANTSRRFVSLPALVAARHPAVILGAVGCAAIFWLGVLTGDARVGGLAAFLLAINPLYRLHTRRAMSDIPAECFILLALAIGTALWSRAGRGSFLGWRWWSSVVISGMMVGLATLSKLNGVLAGLVLMAWGCLAIVSPAYPKPSKRLLGLAAGVAAAVAFGLFVVLNPFLTAQPLAPVDPIFAGAARLDFFGRVGAVYHHRESVSRLAMRSFPNDALPTLVSKVKVVSVQGFGRFGPLGPSGRSDSTRRFDLSQDWGSFVWLPCVLAGFIILVWRGVQQVQRDLPPSAWLIPTYLGVVVIVVTAFIPLAWDRYMMSIQPAASLVGASWLVAVWDQIRRKLATGEQIS